MSRYQAIEHPDGYWYVWDDQARDEHGRFDTEEDAGRAVEDLSERTTTASAVVQPFRIAGTGPSGPLYDELFALRGQIAVAAQHVYDEWEQDEWGLDHGRWDLGRGGACDKIADAVADVIAENVSCNVQSDGEPGGNHTWVTVVGKQEAYIVDIDHSFYEIEHGYLRWEKIEGVQFAAAMVSIVEHPDPPEFEPDE